MRVPGVEPGSTAWKAAMLTVTPDVWLLSSHTSFALLDMDVRIRLRTWLESRLNEGWIDGLCWIDQSKGIFRIPWKHHSKHTWTEQDAAIFKDWAVVTGRYREGIDEPDWPMWKTRLRCALNKAPDIQEVKQRHNLHCDEPFKVYRFISKSESLWRANATRNASMMFDGVPAAMTSLSGTFNVQNVTPRPPNTLVVGGIQHKRPAILVGRISSLARNGAAPYPTQPGQITLVRRHNQIFVKKLSLRSLQPSSSQGQPITRVLVPQQALNSGQPDSLDVGAYQDVLSSPSSLQNSTNSVTFLQPTVLPLLPDIMEPELHQLGVRIQHLHYRLKDVIVTNPNGCCIYHNWYDEQSLSKAQEGTLDAFSITSSPDPIEVMMTHDVADEHRPYVTMLLDNMVQGVILTADSTTGDVYMRRLCRCAAFIYYLDESSGEYIMIAKVARRDCFKIFDYQQFMTQLEYYRLGQGTKPHFEVIISFGQQIKDELSSRNLLVWCRVASCKAWFQYQGVISSMRTPQQTFVYPQSLSSYGSHQSQQHGMLVGDSQQSTTSGDDVDVCASDAVGTEVSLFSPSAVTKMDPTEVEEEIVVSTSIGDDVAQDTHGEVITETIEEVEIAQDEGLLNDLD
ncbi:hypothetical protein ACTXT7_012548 [Hymenolepis weldensis]